MSQSIKLFNAELHKLEDDKSYSIYPVTSKTLPDKIIGRGFRHGGIAAYWPVEMNNAVRPLRELSNDRMVALKYKYKDCSLYVIGVYLPHPQCKIANFCKYWLTFF